MSPATRLIAGIVVLVVGLVASVLGGTPSVVLRQGFDGPSEVQGCLSRRYNPPDPGIAVGLNHAIVTVNSRIFVYRIRPIQVITPVSQQSLDDFFGAGLCDGQPPSDLFDPHCVWDHYLNRFIVVAIAPGSPYIWIAVSTSSDPTLGWTVKQYQNTVADGVDYPGVGYDDVNWYVTVNLSANLGALICAFKKSEFPGANPYTQVVSDGESIMPAMAWYPDPSDPAHPNFGYFMEAFRDAVTGDTSIRLHVWDNIGNGYYDDPTKNPFVFPFSAWVDPFPDLDLEQCEGRVRDERYQHAAELRNCVYQVGKLYSAHAPLMQGREQARWIEVQVNGWPAVGTPNPGMTDGYLTSDYLTFMPAIARNRNPAGHLGMVVATAEVGTPPGIGVFGGLAEPTISWTPLVNVKTGLCATDPPSPIWGDFFEIAVDPVDGSFWIIGEYWKLNDTGQEIWGTWIQNFRVVVQ
ncbi:MAG: hypothetical protein AB1898_33260 [Acidobacteriota bacterium]